MTVLAVSGNPLVDRGADYSLATQRYPCAGKPLCTEPLVLVHGWASDSRIWQPLREELSSSFELMTLDLPGFGNSAPVEGCDLQLLLALMAEALPGQSILLGWSLGGMLALEYAARFPERVSGLVTVGSNASFIQRPHWRPAMEKAAFVSFRRSFDDDPLLCLRRFSGLEAKGEPDERRAIQQLRRQLPSGPERGSHESWRQGLAFLEDLDQRRVIAELAVSALFIFADGDRLVPAAVADEPIYQGADRQVAMLDNCGHGCVITAADRLAHNVCQFIARLNRKLDKLQIAQSFSRAAASYDRVARLQRETGHELFDQIPNGIRPQRILDLGCGTGYFSSQLRERFPDADVVGLDLAEGMVRFASQNSENAATCSWLCGDAEALPLADGSFDLVFSNLVLQWCEDLPTLSAELLRILATGGLLLYTSLGPETLRELRAAWRAVDEAVHVNSFPAANLLSQSLANGNCRRREDRQRLKVLQYAQLSDLTAELKGLGAHNVNQGRRTSITGRARIAGLLRAYERFRCPDGQLPATWDVVYGRVEK